MSLQNPLVHACAKMIWAVILLFISQFSIADSRYVGAEVCRNCHQQEYQLWHDSHHAESMQLATPETVLGDFNDASFNYFGRTSRFYRKDGRYWVDTENNKGRQQSFVIDYTFGVYPLQQYLIRLDGGRYQALSIAWDSRPKKNGGQRWYHLYPDEPIDADDPLHWTGPYQNWNSRCAHCHSTALKKNYDLKSDRYATDWSEINVACEACHGPASQHLDWANKHPPPVDPMKGFVHSQEASGKISTEVCAGCHSRRSLLAEKANANAGFHDSYRLQLLQTPYYHADGQIRDEVFTYGSFIQSKMFHNGVQCNHCHEPHGLKLRAEGNKLCTQCHDATRFDNLDHHQHRPESSSGQCVNCHMPVTVYMGVDRRRDHSLRIPRPDLSPSLGAPNACNQCHKEQSTDWAAAALEKWLKNKGTVLPQHYGEILVLSDRDKVIATEQLQRLAADSTKPAIVRATALTSLDGEPIWQEDGRIEYLESPDPLLRRGALSGIASWSIQERVRLALPLLNDPILSVRLQAFEVLLPLTESALPQSYKKLFAKVEKEYMHSLYLNADTPEGRINLANNYVSRGLLEQAEEHFKKALQQAPQLLAGLINLADLYRMIGRDDLGEPLLKKALQLAPEEASIHYALALSAVRQNQLKRALTLMRRASELAPDVQYGYAFALLLKANGNLAEAIHQLTLLLDSYPDNLQILSVLVDYHRQQGTLNNAKIYLRKLEQLKETNRK